MDPQIRHAVQTSYAEVADEYAGRLFDELRHKPLDQRVLDRFAERLRGRGPVIEVGCGPGQVARYLHERGVQVTGLDLSPDLIERARRLSPEIPFLQGDMAAIQVADGALAGIVGFYSILHFPPPQVPAVLRELARALRKDGLLLLAFHVGTQPVHLQDWWGHRVSLDFYFFEPESMAAWLREAGFEVLERDIREPYPDVEHPSRRAYVLSRSLGVLPKEPDVPPSSLGPGL